MIFKRYSLYSFMKSVELVAIGVVPFVQKVVMILILILREQDIIWLSMFLLSFCYFCLIIILRLIICGSIPARMDFPIVQYYLFVRMGMVLCGLVLVRGSTFLMG